LLVPGPLERVHRAADFHHHDREVSARRRAALASAEPGRSDEPPGPLAHGRLGPDGDPAGDHLFLDAALLHPRRRHEWHKRIGPKAFLTWSSTLATIRATPGRCRVLGAGCWGRDVSSHPLSLPPQRGEGTPERHRASCAGPAELRALRPRIKH